MYVYIIMCHLVPTVSRNLNYTDLTATGVTLTWRRPNPPNGLITQYNVSDIILITIAIDIDLFP